MKRYITSINVNGVLFGLPEGSDPLDPYEEIPADYFRPVYLSAYDEACERFELGITRSQA